jgi:hypothetical protein
MRKLLLLSLFTLLFSASAFSYETDQYSTQLLEIKDEAPLINAIVNDGFKLIVNNWNGPRDDARLIKKVFKLFSSRELERWATLNSKITNRGNLKSSIYQNVRFFNSVPVYLKGIAPTINIGGIHMGTDKLSHFFGVGRTYFTTAEIMNPDLPELERMRLAIAEGAQDERRIWGELTTNVFSNADVVTNFEGFLFYKSIFQKNIVGSKSAIVSWNGSRPQILRDFDIKDHTSPLWNEALFPSHFQLSVKNKVKRALFMKCEDSEVRGNMHKYDLDEAPLLKKYPDLELKIDPYYKLRNICNEWDGFSKRKKNKIRKKFLKNKKKLGPRLAGHREIMNSSPYSLMELKKTFIPGCKKAIDAANNRYKSVLSFYETKMLTKIAKLESDLSKTNFNNLKDLAIASDISFSQYSEDKARVCLIKRVPLNLSKKEMKIEKDIYVSLKSCYQVNQEGEITDKNFSYYMSNLFRTRFSIGDYYSIYDRNGFIYRSVANSCKWY